MPERLSRASAATCAALACAAFGGAYALAHGGPAKPAPAPGSPTTIRLADDPVGALDHVRPLPALIVSRRHHASAPAAQPVATVPSETTTTPAPAPQPTPTPTPTPTPAPTPTPTPKPKPPTTKPTKPPVTFDDSG
jgi:outer membrane biosynthesis protein TonB